MKVSINALVPRGPFMLHCDSSYDEGVHLISGKVGSGKSTLAMALAALLPFQGEVSKEGIDGTLLSLQFPEYHITASTVDDEIRSWGLDPSEVKERAGLEGRGSVDPFKLSRGQLKRLNLACVFARDPDLLLLDEPFSSLDCNVKARLCKAIESRAGKVTIVFSHERSVLPRVDSLSHIEDGRLIHHGKTPGSLREWMAPPPYLRRAWEMGAEPNNIRLEDAREAICATRG